MRDSTTNVTAGVPRVTASSERHIAGGPGIVATGASSDPSNPWSRSLASSFDDHADEYDRYRPGYPDAAVDLVVPLTPATVLDLAAGTGKLTASLAARGHRVVAVEPLPSMRAVLARRLPGADARAGSAEEIPLPDAAVDAVVVGQAFHWFDPVPALDEIARVTRPGGTLGLLWNNDDHADPLVAELQRELHRLGRPHGGSTGRGTLDPSDTDTAGGDQGRPPFRPHPRFTEPELHAIRWTWRGRIDELLAMSHTYSYVIRAEPDARTGFDRAVRAHAERLRPGAEVLDIPVVCRVWRAVRR